MLQTYQLIVLASLEICRITQVNPLVISNMWPSIGTYQSSSQNPCKSQIIKPWSFNIVNPLANPRTYESSNESTLNFKYQAHIADCDIKPQMRRLKCTLRILAKSPNLPSQYDHGIVDNQVGILALRNHQFRQRWMPVIAGPADPQAQIAGVRSAGWSF
jgi:hypothetical protein